MLLSLQTADDLTTKQQDINKTTLKHEHHVCLSNTDVA